MSKAYLRYLEDKEQGFGGTYEEWLDQQVLVYALSSPNCAME